MQDMNTDATLSIDLASLNESLNLAQKLGQNLKGGEFIELIADVGGGKTTLTKGIALGAGSLDDVSSPTFTISKFYRAEDFDIHHFDFYRLKDAGIIENELAESLSDPKVVTIIEWSDIVADTLPPSRLQIELTPTGDRERKAVLSWSQDHSHLLEGIA